MIGMGFMDWIHESVKAQEEEDWKNVDPATRAYYKDHPERRRGVHSTLGRSGPRQALIDLIGTDNMDALLHDCAPALTDQANASYVLNQETVDRLKALEEKLGDNEKYQELKGKYEALQEHYNELKEEREKLIELLQKKDAPSLAK